MKKPLFYSISLAVLIGLAASALLVFPVSAHQTVPVGKYQVEIGWLDEPPVAGQRNAIVVNVSLASPAEAAAPSSADASVEIIDISKLTVSLVYGGLSKALALQPLGEDTPNQYIAPIVPTLPGKYTVAISGILGDALANIALQPEEVEPAEALQFPLAAAAPAQPDGWGLSGWLALAALCVGLISLAVSLLTLRRARR